MDGIAVSSVQATKRSTPRRAMQGFANIANTHFELPQKDGMTLKENIASVGCRWQLAYPKGSGVKRFELRFLPY
jgi:hypothetical protein